MGTATSLEDGSPEEQLTTACQFVKEYELYENQNLGRGLLSLLSHLAWWIYKPEEREAVLPSFVKPVYIRRSKAYQISQYAIVVIDKIELKSVPTSCLGGHARADLTDHRNTSFKYLGWGQILQGLSGRLVEWK